MKRYIALLLVFTLLATLMSGCIEVVEIEEPGEGPSNAAGETGEDSAEETKGSTGGIVNPSDPLELIVILGNHQNAWLSLEDLDESDGEFMKLLARTIEYGKDGKYYTAKCHLKVIVCDGKPSEVELKKANGKTLELYARNVNKNYIQNVYLEELTEDIVDALQGDAVVGKDTEVDLHAALREASYKFETTDREHMIYIMDTGLCTTGALKLKAKKDGKVDLLGPTADELMVGLNSGDFLNLENVRVKFRNFADFCGQQSIIEDEVVRVAFQDFWRTFLAECGVENPEVEYDGSEYDAAVDLYDASRYPTVTVVNFRTTDDGISVRPASEPFDMTEDADLILNGASVDGFDKNSHVPNNVEAAVKIAEKKKVFIDRILKIYPDCVFYVIGSSSYVKDKFRDYDPDAEGRAKTVAGYLIEAGVPEDRIIIVDAGSHKLPWRNADELKEKDDNQVVAIIPSYRVEIMKELHEELPDRIPAPEVTNET